MNIFAANLKGLRVLSLQTGQTVAYTTDPIINPDSLEILAFYCTSGKDKQPKQVLLVPDIRQLSKEYAVIDSADELEDPTDIIRLQQVIDLGFNLLGLKVVNESGMRLGKVQEYTIEVETYRIHKIYTKQPIYRSFFVGQLIIDRAQIVDVTPKQLVVRDATVGSEAILGPQPVIQK